MSGTVGTMIGLLAFWMAACCFCGFRRRFVAFLAVLISGLAAHMAWMVIGLDAHPFEVNALIAQATVVLYALCAFGIGLFMARVKRVWSESRVDGS